MADTTTRERFVLKSDKRRKHPVVIARQVYDDSFLPGEGFWVEHDELGSFPSKDAARQFMIGRSADALS